MHVLRCCGTYLLGSECQFRFLVELTHKTQLYFQTFVMLSRYSNQVLCPQNVLSVRIYYIFCLIMSAASEVFFLMQTS